MDLIATKKLRYDRRNLAPGEPFTANNRDGKILVGIRKARLAPDVRDELFELRETAKSLGIKVDLRWGLTRLREEIAAKR